jgi:hypothetical protein
MPETQLRKAQLRSRCPVAPGRLIDYSGRLREDGPAKVREGLTSIAEVERMTSGVL